MYSITHTITAASTGIRFDHQEFQGRAVYDNFDLTDEVTGSNQQRRDCNGHGTHVAALVAGKIFGAAKGARVFSTRVVGCDGTGPYSIFIHRINHVIMAKQRDRSRRIVINTSLGGPPSQALLDTVADVNDVGILVVVAAGNGFIDACRLVQNLQYF